MESLVEYVAKSLVDDPQSVKVRKRESTGTVVIELRVAQEDTGRIIGKGGRVANALRTLLMVSDMNDGRGRRVILKIN
jgi:predicted RNA-binding protein YlqC (UPF0109 family)